MSERKHGIEVCRIEAADGSGEAELVPEWGAIVSSLQLKWRGAPRELLFQHAFFWDRESERTRGGLPFLFPICGRLERDGVAGAYLYDGCRHEMKIHGFSLRMPWTVTGQTASSLTATLRDTEATRASYPFRFEVALQFEVNAGALTIRQTYANTGDVPLPYYAGFHPYYLTPPSGQGKERVRIGYDMAAMYRCNARLTDVVERLPPAPMPAPVTDPLLHERLTAIGSDREIRLEFPDGMTLHARAEGVEDAGMFRFVQLYTMADKPFFCVEPWMAAPNTLNAVTGCRWVKPGEAEHGLLTVWTS